MRNENRNVSDPFGSMIFITHQIPKGLQVDEVIALGEHGARMEVVSEEGLTGRDHME